jgi:hypothetical protein
MSPEVFGVPMKALRIGSFEHRYSEEVRRPGKAMWSLEVETECCIGGQNLRDWHIWSLRESA